MSGSELVIVGLQSGDEGKGKYTDIYASDADFVVRFQGGPHTGHTVVLGGTRHRFIQVPSGVLRGSVGVLGNGCVVEPGGLLAEIDALRESGFPPELVLSQAAHVIFPYHRAQDQVMERWRGSQLAVNAQTGFSTGLGQLGSTKTGVGPCREDKMARIGLRLVDLLDADLLATRLERLVDLKRRVLEDAFALSVSDLEGYRPEDWDAAALAEQYHQWGLRLGPCLGDVSRVLYDARRAGRRIVYEGAQSFGLDVEHGTYPFCSSGYSAASGVTVGTGSSPSNDFQVYGVLKGYMCQVGGGPLPTELHGALADHIVERGREYGTVTGRRRRVGWLDLGFVNRAVWADGASHICLSSIDVLAGLPEVRVATHYRVDGEEVFTFPVALGHAARLEPVYETLAGWADADWPEVARHGFAALPDAAQAYVEFIRQQLGVSIAAIGVGPERNDTIICHRPW